MTNWREVARRALLSGSCASLISTAALLALGRRDCLSVVAPVNAISHWVWGERAVRQQGLSLRYTLPGYLIHHAASVFWAGFHEASLAAQARPAQSADALVTGIGVAAVACVVDLCCTPPRLTPGFERRLRSGSLAAVYFVFALGLALPGLLRGGRGTVRA